MTASGSHDGAPLALVLNWLLPVAACVRNSPTRAEAELTAVGLWVTCADFPASLFSERAQMSAMRGFQVWPSVAEFRALLMCCAEEPGAPPSGESASPTPPLPLVPETRVPARVLRQWTEEQAASAA